jgi:hypothetical protein
MHGRTPKVSHFHVFGCKCFILKKGKKLDMFEARSVDGIFFGYASHSIAYRMLTLETNQIMETCEVTFDKTHPHSQLVFECAGDDELGEEIFQEEEHELGDDEDGGVVPPAEHVPTTSTTVVDGPSPTPTTTNQDREEATVEGEVASRREPPRRVQVDHPASRIIGDMNERTTRSRVRTILISLMLHLLLLLSPKTLDTHYLVIIGLIRCMRSWRTLRGIRFGNLLTLPQGVSRLGQSGCGRTKREKKVKW